MNFQVPQPKDEFDYYANSSQDNNRGGQSDRNNGIMSGNKKRPSVYSSDDDQDGGGYSTYIAEERYRAMLGKHVNKYKKKHNNSNFISPVSAYNGMSERKSSLGLKGRNKGTYKTETASNFVPDSTIRKPSNYAVNFSPHLDMERFVASYETYVNCMISDCKGGISTNSLVNWSIQVMF